MDETKKVKNKNVRFMPWNIIFLIFIFGLIITNIGSSLSVYFEHVNKGLPVQIQDYILGIILNSVFFIVAIILYLIFVIRLNKVGKTRKAVPKDYVLAYIAEAILLLYYLFGILMSIRAYQTYSGFDLIMSIGTIIFYLSMFIIAIVLSILGPRPSSEEREKQEAQELEAIKPELITEYKALQQSNAQLEYEGKSKFDGNTFQLIGWRILGGLLTGITLGFGFPFAVTFIEKWKCKHTVINGRRLSFDGNGFQLLGKWILWGLLTIVTLGIYSFFIGVKVRAWVVSHTTMVGGKEGVESKFDGKNIQYLGWKILTGLMTIFTLGLLKPVAVTLMMKWEAKHTTYNGYRLYFDGNGFQLLGKWILWLFLGIVTFGIYWLSLPVKLTKWQVSHQGLTALMLAEKMHLADEGNDNNDEEIVEAKAVEEGIIDAPVDGVEDVADDVIDEDIEDVVETPKD